MSAEEILNAEYKKWVYEKGIQAIYPPGFPEAYKEAALLAIIKFAKQENIAFGNWLYKNYTQDDITGKWVENARPLRRFAKTTEELYDIFVKQQLGNE